VQRILAGIDTNGDAMLDLRGITWCSFCWIAPQACSLAGREHGRSIPFADDAAMGRSTTNVLRFAKIAEDRELGSVMVQLMIASNDLALAHESLGYWRNPRTRKEENRATGALRYFLRLQIAHVFEAP
jgi:hypothetical protein